jgi:hypothetical protein
MPGVALLVTLPIGDRRRDEGLRVRDDGAMARTHEETDDS